MPPSTRGAGFTHVNEAHSKHAVFMRALALRCVGGRLLRIWSRQCCALATLLPWQGVCSGCSDRGFCTVRREASLPQEYVPAVSKAVEKVGLKWKDFKVTDNSCKPHPTGIVDKVPCAADSPVALPAAVLASLPCQHGPSCLASLPQCRALPESHDGLLLLLMTQSAQYAAGDAYMCTRQVEKGLEAEVKEVEYALENDLTSFGKGFTVIEQARICGPPSLCSAGC